MHCFAFGLKIADVDFEQTTTFCIFIVVAVGGDVSFIVHTLPDPL